MTQGMSSTLAEYWMLKEVSQWKDYGTEHFRARWMLAEHGASIQSTVAVSPQGVCITSLESDHRLRYSNLSQIIKRGEGKLK